VGIRISQSSDYIHDNLVKIIGEYRSKSIVVGTGFFVSKEYCLTCHHVICHLEKLQIEYLEKIYDAEWVEEISDPEKDIAVLYIRECNAKPMILAGDSFSGMKVKGCGFSHELLENLPHGKWFEGELSNLSDTQFNYEEIKGNKRWNNKPTIRIRCHQLDSKYLLGEGMSGSPVCYYDDYRIIGMLMAINKGGKYEGYVIPVKTILGCVQIEQSLSAPNQTRSSEILLAEGNRYFLQNEIEMALQQYDKIINDPNFVSALNNKGKALEKLGRNQEAKYCYQMATTINSQASLSWYNKGWILHKEGKFIEALGCFNEALNIDSNNANLWFYKAVTLSYMEKYDESIESCNKALEIDPNNAKVWNNKSYTLQTRKV
jgi:Tfp pilus assembly protein PilF